MADAPASVVIIGAGLAGAKTAEALREQGYAGPVTLLGSESELPYERPPLSKGYLAGKAPFEDAVVHPQDVVRRARRRPTLASPRWSPCCRAATRSNSPTAPGSTTGHSSWPPAPSRGACRSRAQTRHSPCAPTPTRTPCGRHSARTSVWSSSAAGGSASRSRQRRATRAPMSPCWSRPSYRCSASWDARWRAVFADLHRDHGVDLRLGVLPRAHRFGPRSSCGRHRDSR